MSPSGHTPKTIFHFRWYVLPAHGDLVPGRLWDLVLRTGDSSLCPPRTQASLVFIFYLDENLQASDTRQVKTWYVFLNSYN